MKRAVFATDFDVRHFGSLVERISLPVVACNCETRWRLISGKHQWTLQPEGDVSIYALGIMWTSNVLETIVSVNMYCYNGVCHSSIPGEGSRGHSPFVAGLRSPTLLICFQIKQKVVHFCSYQWWRWCQNSQELEVAAQWKEGRRLFPNRPIRS